MKRQYMVVFTELDCSLTAVGPFKWVHKLTAISLALRDRKEPFLSVKAVFVRDSDRSVAGAARAAISRR